MKIKEKHKILQMKQTETLPEPKHANNKKSMKIQRKGGKSREKEGTKRERKEKGGKRNEKKRKRKEKKRASEQRYAILPDVQDPIQVRTA